MQPVISGTVAGQTVDQGSTINPFASATVTEPNNFITDTTLTISLLDDNGNASDANGTLTLGNSGGDTFSETSPGVYTLVDHSPPTADRNLTFFTTQLPDLTFIPGKSTTFVLTATDSYGEQRTDNTTSVIVSGSSGTQASTAPDSPPAAPATDQTAAADTTAVSPSDAQTTAPTTDQTVAPDTTAVSPSDAQTAAPATDQTVASDTTAVSPSDAQTTAPTTDQTVALGDGGDSHLTIKHPRHFHGHLSLTKGDIDLNGLAKADSYSFKNDMLSIFGGGKTLDTIHLTSATGFSVEKTPVGVSIYTADDTHHTAGTLLPLST